MCRRPTRCMGCNRAMAPYSQTQADGSHHRARGLCSRCHSAFQYTGELIAFERLTRTRDELLEDWELLRAQGLTRRQAAERMRMPYLSFNRALQRARAGGDPRAVA